MHRLALNHRVDWNTVSPRNIRVTGIFTARAGSPIGLVHQNHRNSKIRTGPGTEPKVFWSAMSGRAPLLGIISGCGLDPDGSLAQ
jgi:hypothetical protein